MVVICYGDSNTFGYDPRSYLGDRYGPDDRWVDILAELTGWEVRNNGMNGRRIPDREVVFSRSADRILLMLGTNDILQGNTARQTAARMEVFLRTLVEIRHKLVLITPPPLTRGEWVPDSRLPQSRELCDCLAQVAENAGILCINTASWNIPMCYDGVHFTEEGHRLFAGNLVKELAKIEDATDS